jgi:hypothetical protein
MLPNGGLTLQRLSIHRSTVNFVHCFITLSNHTVAYRFRGKITSHAVDNVVFIPTEIQIAV